MIIVKLHYALLAGPSFWGLINPDWSLCNSGRLQSPIDVQPASIVFDPGLKPLQITDVAVSKFVSLF